MSAGGVGQLDPQGRKRQGFSTSIVWHDEGAAKGTFDDGELESYRKQSDEVAAMVM